MTVATETPPVLREILGKSAPAAPGPGLNNQAARLQELLARVEALPNPAARMLVQECMQSLLALYGEGLARVLALAHEATESHRPVLEALLADPTVSGLLLIHGLHPWELETRLRRALDKVRPYIESHGGKVELVSLQDDFARLRMAGTCSGCPASSVTLQSVIQSAFEEICPDLAGFEVEGLTATP